MRSFTFVAELRSRSYSGFTSYSIFIVPATPPAFISPLISPRLTHSNTTPLADLALSAADISSIWSSLSIKVLIVSLVISPMLFI